MRNKVGVAAGVLLAVSVAGGVGATLWQASEAKQHAALAERQAELARQEATNAHARAERAEDVRDFLGKMFSSEEHTSELQSLMRISYAVFCLKKKNTHTSKSKLP